MNHGNQYASRKGGLRELLDGAHLFLLAGFVSDAQRWLAWYRAEYARAPASTKRRWRCGK